MKLLVNNTRYQLLIIFQVLLGIALALGHTAALTSIISGIPIPYFSVIVDLLGGAILLLLLPLGLMQFSGDISIHYRIMRLFILSALSVTIYSL